ncbi:MAG: hypothetical protein E6772_09525 [Dysgonomonas sp.]|nr:hypothetical protein [Dysgonomonas sp.]
MKKITIIFCMLMLLVTACNNDDHDPLLGEVPNLDGPGIVTFAQDMDGVSVLIFGKKKGSVDQFIYQKGINSGWSSEGKVSTAVEMGDYKFLFMKSAWVNTTLDPTLPAVGDTIDVIEIDDLEILTKADSANPGYTLATDEIWLSRDAQIDSIYEIQKPTTVKDSIERIVSLIELKIEFGYLNGGNFIELDTLGIDVAKLLKINKVKFDVTGVGEKYSIINKSIGSTAKTMYVATQPKDSINGSSAIYEGPFVFPPAAGNSTKVKISIETESSSPFPNNINLKEITNTLQYNHKLVVKLRITDTYQFFDISVDAEPISNDNTTEGDNGVWE